MKKLVWSFSALILLTAVSPLAGQTIAPPAAAATPDAEQQKLRLEIEKKAFDLLAQSSAEAASLKLPENRIYVYTVTAELLWAKDEKRARRLFQDAATEINRMIAQHDETDYENQQIFYAATSQRQQMINKVGQLDAEFALELLRQTRLPVVREYLTAGGEQGRASVSSNAQWQVEADNSMEQGLLMKMAEKDVSRGVQVARQIINRKLSHNIFSVIEQIKKLDEKVAAQLVEELAAKLVSAEWSPDDDSRSMAASFLSYYAPPPEKTSATAANDPKQLLANDKYLREISDKLAASYLSSKNNQMISSQEINYIVPLVERYAPNRTARLRQRANELADVSPEQQIIEKIDKLEQEGTPEQMLAEAANVPVDYRTRLYQSAASKVSSAGNPERARQILESIPSKAEREMALKSLESNLYYQAVSGDKLDDAYKIANRSNDDATKFENLINLATTYHNKKQPEAAARILQQAEGMLVLPPADEDQMRRVLRLAQASAAINPARSLDLLEPLVVQSNELIAASAVVGKFYKRSSYTFRDGELVLPNAGNSGWYISDPQAVRYVAAHDFNRLTGLIDRFERSDVRLALRLMLIPTVIEKKAETATVSSPTPAVVPSPTPDE